MKFAKEVTNSKGYKVIELIEFELEARENKNGKIEIYPTEFIQGFENHQYPLIWRQGFIVFDDKKIFSSIYPEGIEGQENGYAKHYDLTIDGVPQKGKITFRKEIAWHLKDTKLPNSHIALKNKIEITPFLKDVKVEKIGGGYLEFILSLSNEYSQKEIKNIFQMAIIIYGTSGNFGEEKNRASTIKLVTSLFPEAIVTE